MSERFRIGTGRNPDLAVASIFGKIKANIDFSFVEEKTRTLIVTSSVADEGKTTIATNIAAAMAASDKKTILIDTDMRNPSAHLLFNLVNSRGLSDIISVGSDWRQFVYKAKVPNLYLITAGRKPSNPSRFLNSERFRALLDALRAEFDYIVLDSPPVLLVPDTQIISPLADGVVLVVKNAKTRRESVKEAHETLLRANANVIGAVLNYSGKKEGIYGYGHIDKQRTSRKTAPSKRPAPAKTDKASKAGGAAGGANSSKHQSKALPRRPSGPQG